jgi:hypothetical protein
MNHLNPSDADCNTGVRTSELSASLQQIAHLLVLVSFYLSVRLPAEITLPHREYPLATISTPANSYAAKEGPFPDSISGTSSSNSPSGPRHGQIKQLPRPKPRPLYIVPDNSQIRVLEVAKTEPAVFNHFLEGICLLAWDIAWLCRSQGLYEGTESWGGICNVGRNLCQLLLSPEMPTSLPRVNSSRDVKDRPKGAKNASNTPLQRSRSTPKLGQYSHTSAHSFLGAAEAQDFVRGWKLGKHTLIVDSLKKTLIAEMHNAEWELLHEEEWDDGGEQFSKDETVVVRNGTLNESKFDSARSILTARPDDGDDDADGGQPRDLIRAKGTSGWTRLRSRTNEPG